MPVYNGAEVIGQAIESVAAQNVPLELIIVDDCSTDQTEAVVSDYLQIWSQYPDKQLIYIKNKKNAGAAASRNRGVESASASWVAFLDADDWWTSDKLVKQLALLKSTGADLCSTGRELMDVKGTSLGVLIPVKKDITYKELLKHNSINCSSVVVRTEVIRKYPMNHSDSHEDYITWLQILKSGYRACGLNEPCLKYRYDKHSKSGNKLKSAGMTYKVYRYMGFGHLKSCLLFVSYAWHGLIKYSGKG